MQKPMTPTPSDVTASLPWRNATAPDRSLAAWVTLSAIMSLPASSGSVFGTESP